MFKQLTFFLLCMLIRSFHIPGSKVSRIKIWPASVPPWLPCQCLKPLWQEPTLDAALKPKTEAENWRSLKREVFQVRCSAASPFSASASPFSVAASFFRLLFWAAGVSWTGKPSRRGPCCRLQTQRGEWTFDHLESGEQAASQKMVTCYLKQQNKIII